MLMAVTTSFGWHGWTWRPASELPLGHHQHQRTCGSFNERVRLMSEDPRASCGLRLRWREIVSWMEKLRSFREAGMISGRHHKHPLPIWLSEPVLCHVLGSRFTGKMGFALRFPLQRSSSVVARGRLSATRQQRIMGRHNDRVLCTGAPQVNSHVW